MTMKLTFPKEYQDVVSAFISCDYAQSQAEVIQKLFSDGFRRVTDDFSMGATAEPNMTDVLIQALKDLPDKTEVEITVPKYQLEFIDTVSKAWGYDIEHAKTIVLVMGMASYGYLFLTSQEKYGKDLEFSKIVDSMPHDYGTETESTISRTVAEAVTSYLDFVESHENDLRKLNSVDDVVTFAKIQNEKIAWASEFIDQDPLPLDLKTEIRECFIANMVNRWRRYRYEGAGQIE